MEIPRWPLIYARSLAVCLWSIFVDTILEQRPLWQSSIKWFFHKMKELSKTKIMMISQVPKITGSMIEGVKTLFHKNFDKETPLVWKPNHESVHALLVIEVLLQVLFVVLLIICLKIQFVKFPKFLPCWMNPHSWSIAND